MEIKIGTINDLENIVAIIKQYRHFYGVEEQNIEDIKRFEEDRIKNNQSKIFLAMKGDVAIGFIQLYPSYSTVSLKPQWILNDLYVAEGERHKGVAKSLMNAVMEHFKTSAKGFILVTDKTNSTAKSFYESCGWETGEYDFYTYFYK